MNGRKIIIDPPVIASIVAVIAIAFASFFYFQLQQFKKEVASQQGKQNAPETVQVADMANWKTYNRGTYQIEVPLNWKAEYPPQSQADPPTNFNLTSWHAPDSSYLRVEYYDTDSKNLDQYLSALDERNQIIWEGQPTKKIVSSKIIIIDGQTGLQRQEQSLGYTASVTYVTSGKNIFIISAIHSTNSRTIPSKPEALQKYDQILSTFRFL